MKILHLCGGSLNSGATLGATALHKGLLQLGVDSELIFSKGEKSDYVPAAEPFFRWQAGKKIFDASTKWIEPSILRRQTGYKRPGLSIGSVGHPFLLKRKQIEAADIIHLHWINSRFIRIKAIRHFNKPIVWTIRDAWPYTGGCHYTNDCDKYKTGCGRCPLIHSSDPSDISSEVINSKKSHLPEGIRYIALSNWTAKQARSSYLLKNQSIDIILNSIDDTFLEAPDLNKETIRKNLDIPQEKTIILAGAVKIDSIYKGYNELLPQLTHLAEHNCHLVTFGNMPERLKTEIHINSTHLGPLHSADEIRNLYHASDIFVAPSTQEAFGKTLAEAGACGLPVVCYDIGGPRNIVVEGVSGYRTEVGQINEFLNMILELATHSKKRESMGVEASRITRKLFAPQVVAKQHIKIYQDLIENR